MKSLVLLLSIFLSMSSNGQNYKTHKLSLSRAIEDGLATNYNIQIADYQLQKAKTNRRKGPLDRFPSIDFSLNQSNRLSRDNSPTSFTDGTYTQSGLTGSINTSWLLFGGFRIKIDRERLEQIEKQKAGTSQILIENTVKQIIQSYYSALIEKDKLNVLNESRIFSGEKRKKAERDFDVERISRFDLNNFKNDQLLDSIKFSHQENRYAQSLIKLKTLTGHPENVKLVLTDKIDEMNEKYDFENLREEMIANSTAISNENLTKDMLVNELKRHRATKMPSLKISNSISDEISTSKFNNEERENGGLFDVYAKLSLSYSIYDGGKHKRRIEQSKIDGLIANKRIDDLKLRMSESLRLNLEEYHRQIEILAMKKSLAKNLSENLSIAEDRLENGYSIFVEYRDARLELLEAQLQILTTIYDMKIAELEIVQLIGGMLR